MSKKPLIIDVEASGLGRGSYPIEVGFALANGESHCAIIHPEAEWQYWDRHAEALHGISRQVLREHGKPIVEVAVMLNEYLAGKTVYTDAWGNDSSWIALLFDAAGLTQQFRLDSLRSLLTEEQTEIWHGTKDIVIQKLGFHRHRASNDALVLQHTYCETARLLGLKIAV